MQPKNGEFGDFTGIMSNCNLSEKAYDVKLRQVTEHNAHLMRDLNVARMKTKAYDAKLRVLEREQAETEQSLEYAQHSLATKDRQLSELQNEHVSMSTDIESKVCLVELVSNELNLECSPKW